MIVLHQGDTKRCPYHNLVNFVKPPWQYSYVGEED